MQECICFRLFTRTMPRPPENARPNFERKIAIKVPLDSLGLLAPALRRRSGAMQGCLARELVRHSRYVRFSESTRLRRRATSCASATRRSRVHRRGRARRRRRRRRRGRERERERADCCRGAITLRYRRLQETGLGPRQSGCLPRTSHRADPDATCKRPMPRRRSSAEPIPVSACLPDRAGAP